MIKIFSKFVLVLFIITFSMGQMIFADNNTDTSVEMEKTVVTATRSETPISDLPVSVTVITSDQIEAMPVTTVDDVLNKAVGVQIRRNKGLANTTSHTTIYMRGTGDSSRVLVLKDGVPLNSAYGGTVSTFNTISLEDIDRIEIVRGASSALYGSSAMGGVINIITKKPEKKITGKVSIQSGSLDTNIGNAYVSGSTDKFAFRLSAGHKSTDGYVYYDASSWRDYYSKPENKLTDGSVGFDFWLGESMLRLDYSHLIEESLSATSTQYDGKQTNDEYMLSWGIPISGGDFSIKSYYFDTESTSDADSYNSVTGNFDRFYYLSSIPKDEFGVMLQYSRDIGSHRLSMGSDLKWAKAISEYAYAAGDRNFRGKQDFYSVFLNDEMSFIKDKLILNAGIRYDYWKNHSGDFYDSTTSTIRSIVYPDKSDNAFSPKAGAVYKLTEKTKLRASFGTGFKSPSLYDLYKSGPHGATRFDLANPDLEAEKMKWSYDLGFDTKPNKDLNISMTFYKSMFKDYLGEKTLASDEVPSWFSPDPGMAVIQPVNLGEVKIYGVEAGIEYHFNRMWSVFVNHTYNVSKITKNDEDPSVEGNYLSYTPRHMTRLGVTYDNPELFSIGVFLTSVGERYGDLENTDTTKLDAYQVADVKISRKLFFGAEIFGAINNVTDEDYREYYTTLNPPRTYMVGMNYNF
ncbi:MAG: TonB-dependent receptor [Deltaproteobacteria bacterium]|nr:TonB-dependent receptor [Deltaproteobacteria bacterium]